LLFKCRLHFFYDNFSYQAASFKLWFALSSVSAWCNFDIDFGHVEFYFAIVDCFEVMPRPVAKARVEDLLIGGIGKSDLCCSMYTAG
jgi:hypothetical protein